MNLKSARIRYSSARQFNLPATILFIASLAGLAYLRVGTVPEITEAPFRIVAAGFMLALLPGLLAGQYLRVRSPHILHALALAFSLSCFIGAPLGLICFALHLTISSWVFVILLCSALLAFGSALGCSPKMGLLRDFLACLSLKKARLSDFLLFLSVGLLGIVLYRWGGDPHAVGGNPGWEVAVHLSYIRQYASGLALDFHKTLLRPDLQIPNLFFYWEFLLSGISRLANVDPVIASLRSRWLIPVLGFSSFYFMSYAVARSSYKASIATWIVLIASVSQFLLLHPNGFVIYADANPLRQISGFLGSIHHADTAMEILLPLGIGFLFMFYRKTSFKRGIAFAAILALCFFWHPREYFQLIWTSMVLFISDFIFVKIADLQITLRKIALLSAVILLTTAALLAIVKPIAASGRDSQVELAHKLHTLDDFKRLISKPQNYFRTTSPMNAPIHGQWRPQEKPLPPAPFSWMLMTLPMALLIALRGSLRDRKVAFFTLALWWLTLCYPITQGLLSLFTYSEILISQARFIYLGCYWVIAVGWLYFTREIIRRGKFVALSACLASGLLFWSAWHFHIYQKSFPNIFLTCLFLFLIISLRRRSRLINGSIRTQNLLQGSVAGLFIVFLIPMCSPSLAQTRKYLGYKRELTTIYSSEKENGLSRASLDFLQRKIPPRSRISVDPRLNTYVSIFAPVYEFPLKGNIAKDVEAISEIYRGINPVFNNRQSSSDAKAARKWLAENKIEFVVAGREGFDSILRLTRVDPESFRPMLVSFKSKEIIARFVPSDI